MQNHAGQNRASDLAENVWEYFSYRKCLSCCKSKSNSGVQMRTGNIAKRINHGCNDQAKCQGNADMSNKPTAFLIHYNGPGSKKNQCECAQYFRRVFFPSIALHSGIKYCFANN